MRSKVAPSLFHNFSPQQIKNFLPPMMHGDRSGTIGSFRKGLNYMHSWWLSNSWLLFRIEKNLKKNFYCMSCVSVSFFSFVSLPQVSSYLIDAWFDNRTSCMSRYGIMPFLHVRMETLYFSIGFLTFFTFIRYVQIMNFHMTCKSWSSSRFVVTHFASIVFLRIMCALVKL